ncbi:MAG: helix-turn-helix domain-containing protein [Alphaproteobacteria bacterium]|jgi:predicted DNA-binding transcriptional regulator AlpA|nr:helix-turn-helix domain-containing protein [Alphaproteobacteria bacterium]
MAELEKLLDVEELADILKLESSSTVYSKYKEWKIPFIKIGGSIRFRPRDIAIWIENKKEIGKQKEREKCQKLKIKGVQFINKKTVKSGHLTLNLKEKSGSESRLEQVVKEKHGLNLKNS